MPFSGSSVELSALDCKAILPERETSRQKTSKIVRRAEISVGDG